MQSWAQDWDSPIKKRVKKKTKINSKKILKDEIEKKFIFKKGFKKNQSQSILIFETRDCDLEAETDLIKGKSKKTMKQDSKKKHVKWWKWKKQWKKRLKSIWVNPLTSQPWA